MDFEEEVKTRLSGLSMVPDLLPGQKEKQMLEVLLLKLIKKLSRKFKLLPADLMLNMVKHNQVL